MYYVLEGLDGTGKTTFATKLIKEKIFSHPMYIYFEKEGSYEDTRNAWIALVRKLKEFNANVIFDRSIISTIAYHFDYRTSKEYEQFIQGELSVNFMLEPENTVIIYFVKVFDPKKLLEYAHRIESIRNNYHLIMNILRRKGYKVITYSGEKIIDLI